MASEENGSEHLVIKPGHYNMVIICVYYDHPMTAEEIEKKRQEYLEYYREKCAPNVEDVRIVPHTI